MSRLPFRLFLSRNNIYYYRWVIPDSLRHLFAHRREFRWSLRTSDRGTAKLKAQLLSAEIAKYLTGGELFMADQKRLNRFGIDMSMVKGYELKDVKVTNTGFSAKEIVVDPKSPDDHKNAMEFLDKLKLLQEGLASSPQSLPQNTQASVADTNSVKISEAIDEYVSAHASSWGGVKTELDFRGSLNTLVEILGDRVIGSICAKELTQFKNILIKLPANRKKLPQYRNLTISEILKMSNVIPMSSSNSKKILSRVKALFQHAQSYSWIDNLPIDNVFTKVKTGSRSKKENEQRDRFTDEDLIEIFNHQRLLAETKAYRFWLPPLGLFTGARINELCQLYLTDIGEKEGFDYIRISDGEENQSLKNNPSNRVIPIHPKLIEMGFLSYVEDLKALGVDRLFPELGFVKMKGYSGSAGTWFSELIKKLNLKRRKSESGDDRNISFHSFRHTVINLLNQNPAVNDKYIKSFVGHAAGNITTARYTDSFDLKTISNELFPYLSFPYIDFDGIKYKRNRFDLEIQKAIQRNGKLMRHTVAKANRDNS